MRLVPASKRPDAARFLWDLQAEFAPEELLPGDVPLPWDEHVAFVERHPYRALLMIEVGGEKVGAIYVMRSNELGIGICSAWRRRGIGPRALAALLLISPGTYRARINARNARSLAMFAKIGFTEERRIADVVHMVRHCTA